MQASAMSYTRSAIAGTSAFGLYPNPVKAAIAKRSRSSVFSLEYFATNSVCGDVGLLSVILELRHMFFPAELAVRTTTALVAVTEHAVVHDYDVALYTAVLIL
jgi:hypothetical protein